MKTLTDLLRSVMGRPEPGKDEAARAQEDAQDDRERRVRDAREAADAAAVRALEIQVTARSGRYYRGRPVKG